MTQFEKSAPGTFLADHGGRNALIYLGVIVLIGAIALIGVAVSRDGSPGVQTAPQRDEVVDGWMASTTAANRAARLEDARRVQDGWSSYLVKPEPAIVDGWSSYLVKPEPEIVDGWASRYLVADDD